MSKFRFAKPLAAALLGFGLLTLASSDEIQAASKAKEAEEFAAKLKSAKDAKTKAVAVAELGKAGQLSKTLISQATYKDMLACLDDKDAELRSAAAYAVGKASNVAEDPKVVSAALVKLLKDDNEAVKLAALNGLGAMGDNAKDAVKDIRDLSSAEVEKIKKKNPDAKGNMLQNKVTRAAGDALKYINGRKN